jgi:hypothetical protein
MVGILVISISNIIAMNTFISITATASLSILATKFHGQLRTVQHTCLFPVQIYSIEFEWKTNWINQWVSVRRRRMLGSRDFIVIEVGRTTIVSFRRLGWTPVAALNQPHNCKHRHHYCLSL